MVAPPEDLTLAQARAQTPFVLRTLSTPGATLGRISYHPPVTSVGGVALTTGRPAVELDYTLANGTGLTLVEAQDSDLGRPLTLDVKQTDSPQHYHQATIDGSPYAVLLTNDGAAYFGVVWKASDGVILRLEALDGGKGVSPPEVSALLAGIR